MVVVTRFVLVGVVLFGATLAVWIARVAFRREDVPGARPFAWLLLSVGAWNVTEAAYLASPSVGVAFAIDQASGLVALPIPVLWLVFTARYTGYDGWLTRPVRAVLWGELAVYAAILASAPFHPLIDKQITFETTGGLTLPTLRASGLYYAQWVISLFLVFVGFGLLFRFFFRARNIYRRQVGTIILGSLITTLAAIAFIVGLSPHPGIQPSSLFITVNYLFIAWALLRYDLLDVTPLASDLVVEELPDPVFVLDAVDRVVDLNPAAELALGISADEAVGTHVAEVAPGLLTAVDSGDQYRHDIASETVVFSPQNRYVTDHHGIDQGRLVLLRDVTVQQRRLDTIAELQRATQQFMSDEIPEDVASSAVETADRVLDHPYAAVLFPEGDQRYRAVAMTERLAADVRGDDLVFEDKAATYLDDVGDLVVKEVDADTSFLADTASLDSTMLLSLGEHGVLGIGTPVGESYSQDERRFARILATAAESAMDRAARERELRESQRLLRNRNEQIEFFNSVLRHDILNGITVIQGHAELLEDHVPADGRHHLDAVQEWTGDIATLTKEIRSIVRAVAEDEEATLRSVDLASVLSSKVEKTRTTYGDVSLTLDVESTPAVRANDLLDQVVENLLMNAVEHNDSDDPRVRVWTEADDEAVRLHVADDGPGIPPDEREQVFDPEVTSDDADTYGFGLYFVRTMVETYGGSVWFEESDMGGAEAIVELPRAVPD